MLKDGTARNRAFGTFGPKVFSGRKHFPDDALESRCLRIYTTGGVTLPDGMPTTLSQNKAPWYEEDVRRLRNQLLRLRQECFFKPLRPGSERLQIENRLKQLYEPIADVLALVGDEGMLVALQACMVGLQKELTDDRKSSPEGRVAAALISRWRDKRPRGSSASM
jgi:hypothetical protein